MLRVPVIADFKIWLWDLSISGRQFQASQQAWRDNQPKWKSNSQQNCRVSRPPREHASSRSGRYSPCLKLTDPKWNNTASGAGLHGQGGVNKLVWKLEPRSQGQHQAMENTHLPWLPVNGPMLGTSTRVKTILFTSWINRQMYEYVGTHKWLQWFPPTDIVVDILYIIWLSPSVWHIVDSGI